MTFFPDLTQTSDIPSPSHFSNIDIITKNFEISSEHNYAMKSIKEILESVPKSYHKHAHLLKHLFRKAVPDRISWDEHGIDYTLDGNIMKDLSITDFINDVMRERKQ